MSAATKTMFGPGAWLGDGRYYVFAVLLPLICLAPWGIVTEAAPGGGTKGQLWGIFSAVPFEFVPFDPRQLPEKLAVAEHVNRLYSVSTAILLSFAAIASTLLGWMTGWGEIRTRKDRIVFGGAWLLLIVLLLVVMDPAHHGARVIALLGQDVFARTIAAIYDGKPYVLLTRLLTVANVIVVVGGATLAIAVTTLACSGSRLESADDLPRLARLRRRLDLILFACALVLGVGLIDMKQWQAWPLPFVANPAQYEKLTNSFVAFQSVCYVGVLAAIYLPTALVLDAAQVRIRRSVAASAGHAPVPTPANDGPTHGEASSLSSAVGPLAVLLRAVTVLSPILVGPLATFIQLKIA
jgi:hypothetical protein